MDKSKQHWPILGRLGTDLANRVRSFMVMGHYGDGLLVVTKDGEGYWLGTIKFGLIEKRTAIKPTSLNVPELVQMAQSHHHILLLNKRGELYVMGENDLGHLGTNEIDQQTYFTPQLISIPHKVTSVRCGYWHSLALTDDGTVWAWGLNDSCQVGVHCSTRSVRSPREISNPHRIVSIECGGWHSLALTDQGEVYGWGRGYRGQLGDVSESFPYTPTRIPTTSPVQSMAAGFDHTLLLTLAGEVWACGDNFWGQLGHPKDTRSSGSLVKVAGLPLISQIASHFSTNLSIAISTEQRCFIWGELTDKATISTPKELSSDYSTVDSPLSVYSPHRFTPHSVTIPETPSSRLSTRMSRMFDNPESSPDVQFVVEQRTIHAHRIILSNSSDYFARMFSQRSLGPVNPEDPIVRVTIFDHSYPAFHAFLRFLYTDSFEIYPDLLPELFELANQYLIRELHQLCLSRMRTTLTTDTCCLYYPLTVRHPELVTFQQELVQFISTRTSEIYRTAAFQSMEPDLHNQLISAVHTFWTLKYPSLYRTKA